MQHPSLQQSVGGPEQARVGTFEGVCLAMGSLGLCCCMCVWVVESVPGPFAGSLASCLCPGPCELCSSRCTLRAAGDHKQRAAARQRSHIRPVCLESLQHHHHHSHVGPCLKAAFQCLIQATGASRPEGPNDQLKHPPVSLDDVSLLAPLHLERSAFEEPVSALEGPLSGSGTTFCCDQPWVTYPSLVPYSHRPPVCVITDHRPQRPNGGHLHCPRPQVHPE